MMRSMFSGVSGLRAHQTRMDVIGNNVANVNTVGFKSGRVTFQEVFNQTLRGAGAPDAASGRGGVNPMQVGLGIGVGAIDTITTRGSLQRTDNPTDLSIEGEGFFIVKGGNADTFKFTRAGNFGVDELGNLVSGSGMNVYGWQQYTVNPADGSVAFNTETEIKPINLYSDSDNGDKRIISAKATENAVFAGNLDAAKELVASPAIPTANQKVTVPMTVYDSLGNEYKISIDMWKTVENTTAPKTTTWNWSVNNLAAVPATGTTAAKPGCNVTAGGTGVFTFSDNGEITNAAEKKPATKLKLTTTTGSEDVEIQLDFSNISMYASDSSVKPTNVDGYPTGSIVTFSIGPDGVLTGIYSNGQQQPLGMLALTNFSNPAGLTKVGDNMFLPSTNSGDYKPVKAGSDGAGTLNPGTLEMSNVDLSREFTDMIITQRGFQANSRIITTSDEMLQELVNLKR